MGADPHAGGPGGGVLARFGIAESALLGRGGEARVFALDDDRVLRLPHRNVDPRILDTRRALLQAIAGCGRIPVPEVLEHVDVDGRTVVIERRLPGRNAMEVLADPSTDRATLIRDHLDITAGIADLPCPTGCFGEIWGDFAITAPSFREWATSRLAASLAIAGPDFSHLDPAGLTEQLEAALPAPASTEPRLVHLDAFLGNMLAEDDRITAVLDFGPMTIGGPVWLDPLVSIAYLATEITPTAVDEDRTVAREWAAEHGLLDALAPAERWMACYWTGAPDDKHLQRWCTRILGKG